MAARGQRSHVAAWHASEGSSRLQRASIYLRTHLLILCASTKLAISLLGGRSPEKQSSSDWCCVWHCRTVLFRRFRRSSGDNLGRQSCRCLSIPARGPASGNGRGHVMRTPTESSAPSTTSPITAATPGTRSSISPDPRLGSTIVRNGIS